MTAETWQTRLARLEDQCPWRPEPIRSAEDLIGRDKDVDNVIRKIKARPTLMLHGETGVGKTSLFAGLEPSLETSFHVIKCAKWAVMPFPGEPTLDPRHDFDRLLATQVQESLGLSPETVQGWLEWGFTSALRDVVYQVTGKMPMLVLDQFEEFLRSASRRQEDAFVGWIRDVNEATEPLKIILSLRSEYQYRLESLLSKETSKGRTDVYPLLPLDQPDDIERVIAGSSSDARPISDPVTRRLTSAWRESQGTSRPLGLLPRKSMLYGLFWRANSQRGQLIHEEKPNPITPTALEDLLECYHKGPLITRETASEPAEDVILSDDVQRGVFYELVKNKLENCEESTRGDTLMDAIVPQVLDQVSDMRTFLATANFKEYRQLDHLFRDANQATIELALGGESPDIADQMVTTVLSEALAEKKASDDMLAVLREAAHDSAVWATDKYTGSPVYGLDFAPWDTQQDRQDKTSGPWLGLAPRTALLHLARMFVMAAQWLDESHVCRVSWDADLPSISLFHDQLSDALRVWGDRHSHDKHRLVQSMITSPFATLGRRLELGPVDRTPGCDDDYSVVANARWTRDQIIGEFRNIAFVNCDFRNTRFSNCRFEGVAFVNCSLDSTLFEGCTIVGVPAEKLLSSGGGRNEQLSFDRVWASLNTTLSAPKFRIPIPPALADQVMTLRGYSLPEEPFWLYSTTSGVAALPLSENDLQHASAAIADSLKEIDDVRLARLTTETLRDGAIGEVCPPKGGLAIIGGRVSALMFSGCNFKEHLRKTNTHSSVSALTLAYVGGSSVDFVEQDEMWLSIYGSAIRGLSFSRHVDSKRMPDEQRFQINVAESALVNTWIGSNIRGEFQAYHSTLQALTSLSSSADGFEIIASARDNGNQQYVAPLTPEEAGDDVAGPHMVEWAKNIEYKTDYRARPAEAEYDKILAKDES